MTQPVVDMLGDLEFAPPCGNKRDCGHVAEWAVRASHGGLRCPADGFICTPCKDYITAVWSDKLSHDGCTCNRCGADVVGQVSDNINFIKL